MNRIFISFFLGFFFLIPTLSFAQNSCPLAGAITSVSGNVLNQETCAGNAQIEVTSVNPDSTTLPTNYRYEYSLVNDTVVKDWQNSPIFSGGITYGTYRIKVRTICTAGTGPEFVQASSITVLRTFVPANILSINVVAQSRCGNGAIAVNATGTAPLTYALVTGINAPNNASGLISPIQNSNEFGNLAPGTHYLRVWDSCGGYATQSVTLSNNPANPSGVITELKRTSCNGFSLRYTLSNIGSEDNGIRKTWIQWPNGSVDTILIPSDSNTHFTTNINFDLSKLDTGVSQPNLPFPDNINSDLFYIRPGYLDACGVVNFSKFYRVNATRIDTFSSQYVGCDSVTYALYMSNRNVNYSISNSVGVYNHFFANSAYSIDGGLTWITLPVGDSLLRLNLPIGVPTTIMMANCGDTVSRTITPNPVAPLGVGLYLQMLEGSNHSCGATIILNPNLTRAFTGDSVTLQFLSYPSGFVPAQNPIKIDVTQSIVFDNLPVGIYEFRLADTAAGALCAGRIVDFELEVVQRKLNLGLVPYTQTSCKGMAGLAFTISPARFTSNGRPVTIEVLEQPANGTLPNVFSFVMNTNSGFMSVQQLTSLPIGKYTLLATDSLGLMCAQDTVITFTLTQEHVLGDSITINKACNGDLNVIVSEKVFFGGIQGQDLNNDEFRVIIYDSATNVELYELTTRTGQLTNPARNMYTIPQSLMNTWSSTTFRILTYFNLGGFYGNPSCTVEDFYWTRGASTIDPSASIFIKGCDGDSSVGTIIGAVRGSIAAPFTWTLFDNSVNPPLQIGQPTTNNIFDNISANIPYILTVSDTCGFGQNYNAAVASSLHVFATSSATRLCPGEDILFSAASIPNATYQWYRNDTIIAGANTNSLQLTDITVADDSGSYRLEVEVDNNCTLLSNVFDLEVDCEPLFVSLGHFDANLKNKEVILDWVSYAEKNNSGFTIQHSEDSWQWNAIGFVKSKSDEGNSTQVLSYDFIHKSPSNGSNYYRLLQTDLAGEKSYSEVRMVHFNHRGSKVVVYPNPATDLVYIKGLEGNTTLRVMDVMGRVVLEQHIYQENTTLSIENLINGTYRISIQNDHSTEVFPLIKLSK